MNSTIPGKGKKNRRLIRGIFFSIIGFIVLLLIAYFVSVPIIEKKISNQLKMLEPAIQVRYTSIHLQLFDAAVRFDNLDLRFAPDLQDTLHRHALHFQEVRLSGIHFFALLKGREFIAENLKLGPSDLAIDRFLLDNNKSLPPGLTSKLGLSFQTISIHRIELLDTKISVDSAGHNQLRMHCELVLNAVRIDHIKDSFSIQNAYMGSVKGMLSDISLPIPGTFHKLHIKSFRFNSEGKTASIRALNVTPEYSKFELGKKFGYQADYVEASIPDIEIIHPDWASLLKNKIKAEKIIFSKTIVYIFRDRRLTRRLKDQLLPAEFLNTLPFDLRIDSLLINPSLVTYEEFPAKGDQTGTLKIEKMRLTMAPLLNHPGDADQAELHSQVNGAIMGSGEVTANISMPLKPNKDYIAAGEFNNLDLTKLNSSAEHLGNLHIESGLLNNLTFNFHFNDKKSSGLIVGEYHNLVIDKLREGVKHMGTKDVIKSFLLQKLIIRKDKDKSLPVSKRTGKINYTRDPTRFVSQYLLQSLLSGVKASFSLGFLLPG